MEDLAPPLALVIIVRTAIESGLSVRSGIIKYTQESADEFANQIRTWLLLYDQCANEKLQRFERNLDSTYRRAVIKVLILGLRGHSIHKNLLDLEEEIKVAADREISQFVSLMPIKLLIPLLLLQFPAYLILVLGPLLRKLLESL